jgi:hypothetical protein
VPFQMENTVLVLPQSMAKSMARVLSEEHLGRRDFQPSRGRHEDKVAL